MLAPYASRPIVVNGVTQTNYGGPGQTQTYFSATPEQQADPYINTFLAQAPGPIAPGLAQRDEARLANLGAQNGAVQAIYPAEEVLVGTALINRGVGAVARLAESLDVVFAGKVAPSAGGNISTRQVTEEGMQVRLTPSEAGVLSKIDNLPSSAAQGQAREYIADNYFMRNGYTKLEGKCGADNCFDAVYVKGDKVYLNEVKPMNADGSIKLNGASTRADGSKLDTQMSDGWVDYSVRRLKESGDPASIRTAETIQAAIDSGRLVKVVSGVSRNGMTIVKLK